MLHLILVPEYIAEARLLGVSFLISAVVTGWVAIRLWRVDSARAWLIGMVTSAGMILGFLLGRTVYLLGYRSTDWIEGIPSVVTELASLVLGGVVRAHAVDQRVSRVRVVIRRPRPILTPTIERFPGVVNGLVVLGRGREFFDVAEDVLRDARLGLSGRAHMNSMPGRGLTGWRG